MAKLFPSAVEFLGAFPNEVPASPLPEILFAGRSNVGKSSAINAILGAKVARTSSTPGRTQAVVCFDVGKRLRVLDLPGYGYAKVSKEMRQDWQRMIGDILTGRDSLILAIALFDARLPAQDLDRTLLAAFGNLDLPVLGLATKVDSIPRAKRDSTVAALARSHGLPADAVIPFSATDNIGIEEARLAIASVLKT
jgi:GTP-binding protein